MPLFWIFAKYLFAHFLNFEPTFSCFLTLATFQRFPNFLSFLQHFLKSFLFYHTSAGES